MPAIIRFLGYNPLPEGTTWGERLVQRRTTLGISQKEVATELGVDPSTLARWEGDEREPIGEFQGRVTRFLDERRETPNQSPAYWMKELAVNLASAATLER